MQKLRRFFGGSVKVATSKGSRLWTGMHQLYSFSRDRLFRPKNHVNTSMSITKTTIGSKSIPLNDSSSDVSRNTANAGMRKIDMLLNIRPKVKVLMVASIGITIGVVQLYFYFRERLFAEKNEAVDVSTGQTIVSYKPEVMTSFELISSLSKFSAISAYNLFMYHFKVTFPQVLFVNLIINSQEALSFEHTVPQNVLDQLNEMGGAMGDAIKKGGKDIKEGAQIIKKAIQSLKPGEKQVQRFFRNRENQLSRMGNKTYVAVNETLARVHAGVNLTIEHLGNTIKTQIDYANETMHATLDRLPFLAGEITENSVRSFIHTFRVNLFGCSQYCHLFNMIQSSRNKDMFVLVDFLKRERVRKDFSSNAKEDLYRTLISMANNWENPLEQRESMFLAIGYTALCDSDMHKLGDDGWIRSIPRNHLANILDSIPSSYVFDMLQEGDIGRMQKLLPTMQFIQGKTAIIGELQSKLKAIEEQIETAYIRTAATATAIVGGGAAVLLFTKHCRKKRIRAGAEMEVREAVRLGIKS